MAEAQYAGDSASIVVTVAAPDTAEEMDVYLLRYRKVASESSEWTAEFITLAQAQSGYSISAELGVSYAIEVSGLNQAGQGESVSLAVTVKARPDAPDFTVEAGYALGAADVTVKVKPAGSDVLGYSVRYRASASDPWTTSAVTVSKAEAGWNFPAQPGATYTVGVVARTEVGLGSYGTATVSIVSRVGTPQFTVTVARKVNGAVATVAVSSPQAQAQYHMFSMDDAAPVKAVMPDADHDFDVVLGNTYRIGVAAGNELGTGGYSYQDVLAVVVPHAPSFTLSPTWRKGEAYLAVSVADPDPHASRYLLKVGADDAVSHTRNEVLAGLAVPADPGQTYTVSLSAGNVVGDSPYADVTRTTTAAEFEALLEWRLILPDEPSPAEAVGAATQYVAIVNGGPVRYDPQPGCVERETTHAVFALEQALSLSGWVSAMGDASREMVAYAEAQKSAVESELATAKAVARRLCVALPDGGEPGAR